MESSPPCMDSVRARTASTHTMMTICEHVRKMQSPYLTHVTGLRFALIRVKAAMLRYKCVSAARKTGERMKVTAR